MSGSGDLPKAKSCALRLIKFRLRSEKEIRDKLKDKEFSPEVIEGVVDFLTEARLLDDALFAKLWVESRIKRHIGSRRLGYELKKKGIDKDIIEKALESAASSYNEEEAISNIVTLKLKKMIHIDKAKAKARIYGFLLRRGYPKDKVYDALRSAFRQDSEEVL